MKNLSKKDKKYVEVLDAERKYRAATGGNDADEPFVTPILFSILDTLNFLFYLRCALIGALVTYLLIH